MNNVEFSNQFDILINSYADIKDEGSTISNKSIELDEYEKSVLLTQAQFELVNSYYTGDNSSGKGFEGSEQSRRFLSTLVKSAVITTKLNTYEDRKLSPNSVFFNMPSDLLYVTYESIKESSSLSGTILVVPITQDSWDNKAKNPFKGVTNNRAFRLDIENNVIEIIPRGTVYSYNIRYISMPKPIILEDLGSLSIGGISIETPCTMHISTHNEILKRAVLLALQKYNLIKNK